MRLRPEKGLPCRSLVRSQRDLWGDCKSSSPFNTVIPNVEQFEIWPKKYPFHPGIFFKTEPGKDVSTLHGAPCFQKNVLAPFNSLSADYFLAILFLWNGDENQSGRKSLNTFRTIR
jgi:hypothetical protein